MARKHVVQYYLEMQNVYFQMRDTMKDFDEMLRNGEIEEEVFKQAQKDYLEVEENYKRISYIMFLLNKPQKNSKEPKEIEDNKMWYDALKGESREAILDESKDALADFKKLTMEAKNHDN